jgi:hypothetical protein
MSSFIAQELALINPDRDGKSKLGQEKVAAVKSFNVSRLSKSPRP